MANRHARRLTYLVALVLAACGTCACTNETTVTPAAQERTDATPSLADGTYDCDVTTDSSMFRAESCTLEVSQGTMVAHLTLPGEGFSRLFFGSAADAAGASADQVFDYRLDEDGRYTFDLPVPALDEDLAIAAFGHRRDTWYDHTICFHTPTA